MRGKSLLFFSAITFSVAVLFVASVATVNAYAVTSTGQSLDGTSNANDNYNAGGSFQTLISPFQNFFTSLQSNTAANSQIYPTSTSAVRPSVNINSSLTNIFTQFDDWFYGLTNIRLSGLVVVVLTGLSWTLGMAKEIANWLLGLFH